MPLSNKYRGLIAVCVLLAISITLTTYALGEEYTRLRYRPLIGGIQIESVEWLWIIPGRIFQCTIGYPVSDLNGGRKGVITAGHCTEYNTGWSIYQPVYDRPPWLWSSNYIGDSSWIAPHEDQEHYDIAFIPNDNVSPYILYITNEGAQQLPIAYIYTINDLRWFLSRYGPLPVNKTGRTTGTTGGRLYYAGQYCYIIVYPYPINITYCLISDYYSDAGDSGAPIFIHSEIMRKVLNLPPTIPPYNASFLIGHHIGRIINVTVIVDGQIIRALSYAIGHSVTAVLRFGYYPILR